MKVQALAEILHVTPQAIVTAAWLEPSLRKNADSKLSTHEAVRLREIRIKARCASRSQIQESPGTQLPDKSKEIIAIYKKHKIDTTTSTPSVPRPNSRPGGRSC